MTTAPTKVLASNLPSLLFSQTTDLEPLFYPYGPIKKLDLLDPSAEDVNASRTSAVVEYATCEAARDALHTLHGQSWAGYALHLRFISDGTPISSPIIPPVNDWRHDRFPMKPPVQNRTLNLAGAAVPHSTYFGHHNALGIEMHTTVDSTSDPHFYPLYSNVTPVNTPWLAGPIQPTPNDPWLHRNGNGPITCSNAQ